MVRKDYLWVATSRKPAFSISRGQTLSSKAAWHRNHVAVYGMHKVVIGVTDKNLKAPQNHCHDSPRWQDVRFYAWELAVKTLL